MSASQRAMVLAGAALAGLAQAASVAWPFDRLFGDPATGQPLWWLQILSLALLVLLLDRLRAAGGGWRAGAWAGGVFATAWLVGTFWWLFISMNTYGGLAAPLAALAVLALAAALALYYALACGCFMALAPTGRAWAAIVFAACWTLAELLRGSLFTGFPWGAGGYAHVQGPLAAYAPWVGVYGVGALAALLAAAGARLVRADAAWAGPLPPRRWPAALWVRVVPGLALASPFLVPLLLGYPRIAFTEPAGRVQMALLQGNIPQDEKFIPGSGIATALRWYGEQLLAPAAPLVVTPETALPLLPGQLPPGYLDAIAARYAGGTQAALVGLPLVERALEGRGYTNSVLGWQPGAAQTYRYDKHHLVPFGEFIPPGFRWFIDLMRIPLGDFRAGGLAQPAFLWQAQRIAPNICYEDLFGEEIGASFGDAANAPTVLLNLSNIAWFGDTVAIDQHLAISRMRALEFQRPMVRATNTGATAVVDHTGRVTHALPRLVRGVLSAEVEGRTGLTPYARWVARFGLAPLWLAALAVLLAAAIQAWHRRRA